MTSFKLSEEERGGQVSEEDAALRRVRFYGVHDLAAGWHVPRVAELVERFDPENASTSTVDILELHNVQHYLERGLLPDNYSQEERNRAEARIPQIRSAVARHFSAIDNTNFASMVAEVGHDYHTDLLELLGRNRAFERCDGATVLPALRAAGVHLTEFLASKKLVLAYDAEIRDELRASARSAEHVIRKYLQDDVRAEIHLPPSFTTVDARELLEKYVDSEDANPNYLGLIATAKDLPAAGIDAKLKLRAKRRNAQMTARFFEHNTGFKTGCEVGISEDQHEPVVFQLKDSGELVSRYTYSSRWLDETCDNPSILNNFVHLFDFVDQQALLVLPSYPAHLGVMERFMGTTGRTEYKIGAAFRAIDLSTLLQTRVYLHYLETKDTDLEQVISWFFDEYVVKEFAAPNFSFTASDRGASFLQKVRHLFVEMESVANQFALFVRDGELDRDLLAMGSEQVRYKALPSLLEGKYIYPTEDADIAGILHVLFSDQSTLNYINEDLKDDDAARLLLRNHVAYTDFADYQKPSVDHLIQLGVLENNGTQVQLANLEQFLILRALFTTQAASYYRLSDAGRAEADAMVAKGWVTRRSSLLTDAEAQYFNYFLNGVDFSNGPELRNKYLHGSQANADGEDARFQTYIIALRLTVALVIKMNDDFDLAAAEKTRLEGQN
jgi:hypothetical protein